MWQDTRRPLRAFALKFKCLMNYDSSEYYSFLVELIRAERIKSLDFASGVAPQERGIAPIFGRCVVSRSTFFSLSNHQTLALMAFWFHPLSDGIHRWRPNYRGTWLAWRTDVMKTRRRKTT